MATTTNFGWTTPDDTDLVKDGAAAIRTLGSAIDTSLVDLKGGTTGQNLRKASDTDLDFTFAGDSTNTVVDAAGDLLYGTANDTLGRLAIGTAGQVLKVNSGATAPEWGAAAGGLTKISVTSFSSVSSVSLPNDSFTSTYNDYLLFLKITGSSTNGNLAAKLRLSGTDATGSDYHYYGLYRNAYSGTVGLGAGSTNFGCFVGFYGSTADLMPNYHKIEIFNPKVAERTSFLVHGASSNNDVTNQMAWVNTMGFHALATAYDSLSIVAGSGTISGSITLYGYES